jgi:hypothetical protein
VMVRTAIPESPIKLRRVERVATTRVGNPRHGVGV